MNTTTFKILFAIVFATLTLSEAAKTDADVPRTRRSSYFGQPFAMPRKRSSELEDAEDKRATYLGFPRLGRGYLALPRMGRSQAGAGSDAAEDGAACCTLGLKKEWTFEEGGKMAESNVCQADACCPGFQEVESTKPDGTFYTMCVPRCSLHGRAMDAAMMLKLKQLLRN